MNNLIIEELKTIPISKQRVEIVERKGLGHPDTICDSIMNQVSVELCSEYLKRVGAILHHNVDKALLAAGEVENRFGGGVVKKPMLMIFGDRATFNAGDINIPINEIAVNTAKKWFKENLRFVDPEKHVKYQVELKRGSAALTDIFKRKSKNSVLGANDTSATVGYAPLTPTESIVLKTEKFLNSKDFKRKFPESGEDIKVMGMRTDGNLDMTIAMAFVDRFIDNEDTYFKGKDEILEELRSFLNSNSDFSNINLFLNTLDQRGRGIDGIYLTVTGTSADGADCGQVGRGNRVNGIIPLSRPAGSEAAAGKNPVSHVGKIYGLLSFKIADEIYKQISGIKEVYMWLLSQIGRPINNPKIAAVQLILEDGNSLNSISKEVGEVIESELKNIDKFCTELSKGKSNVC